MTSRNSTTLLDQYQFQTQLITHHTDGITDEESLLQPPFDTNCMNWVVGHIVSRRHSSIEALGAEPLWNEEQLASYRTGSDPIASSETATPFSSLMADLDRSMMRLSKALEIASDDDLNALFTNDRGQKSIAEHLRGFLWHETYHIGQLEILRAFIHAARSEG